MKIRNILLSSLACLLLISCGENANNENMAKIEKRTISLVKSNINMSFDADKTYHFQKDKFTPDCTESDVICAVDLTAKCTINPKMEGCTEKTVPSFIFQEFEAAKRPSQITFNIIQIKQTTPEMISVVTKSKCDEKWYGLCQDTVIYILNTKDKNLFVSDIYSKS